MKIDKIRAYSKREGMFYIDNLYWFEENGVRDWGGAGHHDEYIFMMPTGVRDTDGQMAYEGDIVRFRTHDGSGVVRYKPPCFMAGEYSLQGYDFEIIGNVHENPELLQAT